MGLLKEEDQTIPTWELPAGEEKAAACVREKLKETICFFFFVPV